MAYNKIKKNFSKKECLGCRKFGHLLKDCPEGKYNICWRCGSNEHQSSNCIQPEDPENPTPFITCFYCNKNGHSSSKCPDNKRGLYPYGGGCYRCNSVRHLAKDCEMRKDFIEEKRLNRKKKRNEPKKNMEVKKQTKD